MRVVGHGLALKVFGNGWRQVHSWQQRALQRQILNFKCRPYSLRQPPAKKKSICISSNMGQTEKNKSRDDCRGGKISNAWLTPQWGSLQHWWETSHA